MKKILVSFMMVLLIGLSISTIHAEDAPKYGQRVFDDANLLTTQERASLEARIETYIDTYNLDLVVVTTANANGKSTVAYADDYYDYNGFGFDSEHSGSLILIDMDNREFYISTTGGLINILSDRRIDATLDEAMDFMVDGRYFDAINQSVTNISEYTRLGDDFIEKPEKVKTSPVVIGMVSVIIGAVVAFFRRSQVTKSYNQDYPKFNLRQYYRTEFTDGPSSDTLIDTRSRSIYSPLPRVNTTRSSRSSYSGATRARSTTHRSSSGRSHGGGGRKF